VRKARDPAPERFLLRAFPTPVLFIFALRLDTKQLTNKQAGKLCLGALREILYFRHFNCCV